LIVFVVSYVRTLGTFELLEVVEVDVVVEDDVVTVDVVGLDVEVLEVVVGVVELV
jgi:hypothetical protein